MIYKLFKSIPPAISVKLFYGLVTAGFLYRLLFQTAIGLFLVSLIFYCFAETLTGVKPFTFSEVIAWLSSLDKEYKVAVITSFVTIIGFIVAFHSATINWRNQMRAQIMLNISAEVENFFATVLRNITRAELYVEDLVKAVNQIQKGASVRDAKFSVDYNQEQQGQFLNARNLLSEASVEVHRLISRNYNPLSSRWGALEAIQRSAAALAEVSQKMWVNIPIIDKSDPHRIQSFINQINITECEEFIRTCKKASGVMSGLTGGVRGQLQSSVLGFNVPMLAGLVKMRKEFRETIDAFHRDLNK